MMNQDISVNIINIPQTIKVRSYDVDIKKLQDILRKQKKTLKLSTKDIADKLDVPLSQVEHYFRLDKCFAIPSEDVWIPLSEMLNIKDAELDKQIMTFEEKEGIFEKSERHYLTNGLAPTICTTDEIKIVCLVKKEKSE